MKTRSFGAVAVVALRKCLRLVYPVTDPCPIFPTRIDGIRADSTNKWNANASRNFTIAERVKMQLRINALNPQNRSQMAQPSTDPFSTNFGRVTSQTAATNRWMGARARSTL